MNLGLRLQSWFIRALVFALVCADAGLAHAQVAAKVTHVTGTVVETDAAGRSRILAADSSVAVGARLSTASDSYAHLKFGDGTDLYLRSNTDYVIEKYQFTEQKPAEDGFVTRLLKGGFRQVTGLLGRRSPAAVRIAAKTSTIGIRGTDFGVRICETTCVGDTDTDTRSRITPAETPIARINALQGTAIAVEALSERERQLADGAAIYRGDVIATGADGQIAFFFRDGTRISLAENSVLAIEDFAYNPTDPASGRATLVQYLGGARVWTGAIGKASPEHFVYRTPNAVITPQGSWWDVVVSTAQAVGGAVASGAQAVGGAVESAAQAVGGAVASGAQAVGGAVASGVQTVGEGAQSAAQATGKAIQGAAHATGQAVQGTLHATAQAVRGAEQATAQALRGAVQQTGRAIRGATQATGQAVRGAAQQTGQAIQGAAQATGQAVQATAQQAAQIVGGAALQGGPPVQGVAPPTGPTVQGTPPSPTPAVQSAVQQSGQAVEDPRSESANQRRQQDEENQRRVAEDQRKQQDEQRKADADAKRKADEDRRKAEDDQRKQQDEQRKQAEEKRKQQEDAQRKADEDRKRAADDQRKQQEEQRKQADEQRKQLETQVTVQEGAVIVTSQQGSQRIDPSSTGLQVIADGRPEPLPGRVEVHAPDPSVVSADPIRLFGEAGGTKADAGVYVTVFDGAVSLKQADVEIVLVKGEIGFADAKNSPPQLLDSPPPILRHDLLLGNAALGSQSCPP